MSELQAVLIGVLCGLVAGIPMSVIMLWFIALRQGGHDGS